MPRGPASLRLAMRGQLELDAARPRLRAPLERGVLVKTHPASGALPFVLAKAARLLGALALPPLQSRPLLIAMRLCICLLSHMSPTMLGMNCCSGKDHRREHYHTEISSPCGVPHLAVRACSIRVPPGWAVS